MSRLPVAVVGVGHLGKEHARILSSLPEVELVGVVDPNRSQAELIAERCNTAALTDYRELIGRIRGAVIAAPTTHHHAIAGELLRAGISLLIEKPITSTPAQAQELVALAESQDLILQVGHIERFNPAFEELQSRPLKPRYLHAERCGGFTGRSMDVGVVLDLMIHDLDLVLSLVNAPVQRVEAMGFALLGGHEDVVQARITFANGCVADLSASRVHPEPRRRMQVFGAEGYAGVDYAKRQLTLMQPGEMLRSGCIDSRRLEPSVAAGLKSELFGRFIQSLELDCSQRHRADQLTRELVEFVHCVDRGEQPRVDGRAGLAALELASRIVEALRQHAWEGRENGAIGPNQIPAPTGRLFTPAIQEAA